MIQPSEAFEFETVHREGTPDAYRAETEWLVPADCSYLDGHFPGQPVLPAVGIVDGSLELLRLSGTLHNAEKLHIKKAKFSGMIQPGMRVKICLQYQESSFSVEWKSQAGEILASFLFKA
jgi:3-hydroxymyristoyl/3-hydroxydecanoyl-(acyl carrier protein) dehydratase